jgi:hypothetical protein
VDRPWKPTSRRCGLMMATEYSGSTNAAKCRLKATANRWMALKPFYSFRSIPIVAAIEPASSKIDGSPTIAASSGLASTINQTGVTIASAMRTADPIQYLKYMTFNHIAQIARPSSKKKNPASAAERGSRPGYMTWESCGRSVYSEVNTPLIRRQELFFKSKMPSPEA